MPVKIHGNDYTTCDERLKMFHEKYKDKVKSILTEIIQFKDGIVVVKAVVKVGEEVYVGHAYEEIGSTQINTTSALENCETSALARSIKFCLGDVDISDSIASAEEVITAKLQQNAPSKAKKVDLSGDGWRDEKIGYKKEEKKNLTWRTAPDEDLIWIISDKCSVDKWKEPAKEEMNLRAAKVEEGNSHTVSKEEADSFFE